MDRNLELPLLTSLGRSGDLNILAECVPRWTPGETLAPWDPRTLIWHLFVEARSSRSPSCCATTATRTSSRCRSTCCSPSSMRHRCAAGSIASRVHSGSAEQRQMPGDTVCCRQRQRRQHGVLVNSNFYEFGSGITVPGYGFVLHNRGAVYARSGTVQTPSLPTSGRSNTLSAGFVLREDGTPR